MSIFKILSYLNVILFLVTMIFATGNKNRLFIKFILLSYPILALYLAPAMDGLDAIVILFAVLFYRKRSISFPSGLIYSVFFLIFMACLILGIVLAESTSMPDFVQSMTSALCMFLFAKIVIDECLEDPWFFYEVLSYLRTTLIVSLLFLCCQFVLGVDFTLSKTQNSNIVLSDAIRYPSFLSDPQVYAQFLSALSFICLIKDPRLPKLPTKNSVLVLLAIIAILATGGRAGLLGWGLGLMIVILFGNSRYRFSIVITCVLLYVVAINFQDKLAIFKRSGDMEETYDFRYAIWQDAFDIFLKNPFFGIGLGNYAHYVSIHNPDQVWVQDGEFVYFDHPESGYLKFLTEMGGAGFVCLYTLILTPLIRGFFLYVRTRDFATIFMIAAVVSWMVGFWSTYSFGDIRIEILIVTILCLLITSKNRVAAEKAELAVETTEDGE